MLWGITIRFQKLSLSQRQVAHVLLTRPPLRIKTNPYSPFDLHVLSVPPAFVLSQDQTLYKSCISISVSTELRSLFNNACVITAHFYTLCLSFPFSKESQGSLLICIVQFSRCCFAFRSLAEHFYYITFRRFCQVLFQVFFKIFFGDLRCSFADQLFYYITFSSVCQVLFQVFWKTFLLWPPAISDQLFYYITFKSFCQVLFQVFSKFLSSDSSHAFRATFILYHLSAVLSSTFFKKSKISANLTFRSPKSFPISFSVPDLSSDSFIIISPFFLIVKQKMWCGKLLLLSI